MKNSKLTLIVFAILTINTSYSQVYMNNEDAEKRTANSKHYALGNGKYSAIISPQNIHYLNEKGNWTDINTTVVPSKRENFTYENTTNGFKSYFGNSGALLTKDNYEVKIGVNPKLMWLNDSKEEKLIETGNLNIIKSDDGKVTYSQAFSIGSIEYVIENETVKNNLILNSLPTNLVNEQGYLGYSEEIVLPKDWLIVENQTDKNKSLGSLSILNSERGVVFTIPAPVVYDNAMNTPNADGSSITNVGYKLVKTDYGYQLITLVDLTWLNNSGTSYPVTIDPTVTLAGTHGGWLNSLNALIEGASPFIYVFAGMNSSGTVYATWVKFNVSSISPCGIVVDSVEAQFYLNLASAATVTEIMNVNDVTGAYGPYVTFNAAAYADLANGLYTSFPVTGVGTYGYYTLGTQANSDFISHLASGQFQIALNISSPSSYKRFTSQLCTLRVNYHSSGVGGTSSTATVTACDSYTWMNGTTYTTSNTTATHVIPNVAGCDSTITLNLTIIPKAHSTDIINSCVPITWLNGNTYSVNNTAAIHTLAGAAANGCDSIIHLNLTILPPSGSIDVVYACDSIVWLNGNTYSANNNTATHVLPNASANGCDSIITLNLTINQPTMAVDPITACASYTWIDGNTYTSNNNTATFAVVSSLGCDSVIKTLNLTIIPNPNVGITQNGQTLFASAGSATYQWINCVTLANIPGATNSFYTPPNTGFYAVVVTQNGCSDTSICKAVNYVGLTEVQTLNFKIFPNPSESGFFTIQHEGLLSDLQLVDLIGRKIEIEFNPETGQINASKLASGKYLLKFKLNGQEAVEELVVL